MNQALDERLLAAVAQAPDLSMWQRNLAVDLCVDAIEIALDIDVPHRGRTARCAAELLLTSAVPELADVHRNQLAHLSELIVVRGL